MDDLSPVRDGDRIDIDSTNHLSPVLLFYAMLYYTPFPRRHSTTTFMKKKLFSFYTVVERDDIFLSHFHAIINALKV